MKVKCNQCGESFKPELQEKLTERGGAVQSFSCTHCSKHYPVATITPRGLEIRKQIQKAKRPEKINALREKMKAEVKRDG